MNYYEFIWVFGTAIAYIVLLVATILASAALASLPFWLWLSKDSKVAAAFAALGALVLIPNVVFLFFYLTRGFFNG